MAATNLFIPEECQDNTGGASQTAISVVKN